MAADASRPAFSFGVGSSGSAGSPRRHLATGMGRTRRPTKVGISYGIVSIRRASGARPPAWMAAARTPVRLDSARSGGRPNSGKLAGGGSSLMRAAGLPPPPPGGEVSPEADGGRGHEQPSPRRRSERLASKTGGDPARAAGRRGRSLDASPRILAPLATPSGGAVRHGSELPHPRVRPARGSSAVCPGPRYDAR